MKTQCRRMIAALLLGGSACFGARVSADDPRAGEGASRAMPAYELQVKVECASPEAAERAELKFLPLPPGKTVAFSCRWDDTNPRNLRMKRLMLKYGYKGTFYIVNPKAVYIRDILPELCKDGCTVGNHTLSHFHLPLLTPNGVFYEMLGARIRHESLTGQTETAFVFPYGAAESAFFPEAGDVIAGCLRRTGILGGPDAPMTRLNKRPGNEFFNTEGCNIRPGDRNTKAAKFDSDVRRSLPKAGKTAHLTLGVHVWHSDADFVELEKALKKHAGQPEWWYCNENEFLAYAHMFRHARIVGKKRDGRTLVFTLEMPCPEYLGSTTPLWAQCDGKNIEIRHARKLPQKIAAALPTGSVPEFPDFDAKLFYPAPDRIRFEAENRGAPLRDVRLILRLPPDFVEETICCHAGDISGKYSKEWRVRPNPAGRSSGKMLTALQIDFTRGGSGGRIWVSRLAEKPALPVAEVFASSRRFSRQELSELARPEAAPAEFLPVPHRLNDRETTLRLPRKIINAGDPLTLLMDFQGGRKMTLKGDLPDAMILCNGKTIEGSSGVVRFDAPAGKCRLLLRYGKARSAYLQLILAPETANP